MLIREAGTREEDEGEDEEDLEEEEETEEEEIEEARREDQFSLASTAEERDTRPPLAQVRRSLEGTKEMAEIEVVKGENRKPLQ